MPTWLRCRDRETGHEFDLAPEDIRIEQDTVEVLTDYPENSGLTAQPRPAKHRVDKAGKPSGASAADTPPADETPPATPPEEDTEAGSSANAKRSN